MTYSKDHEFADRPDLGYPAYSNTGFKTEASAFAKASYSVGATTLFGDLQLRTAEFRYRPTEGYGLDEASERWSFVNPKLGVTTQATERLNLFASYGTTGREPTRSDWRDSTLAMNRAVSPVRTIRFADSSSTATSRCRWGSAAARSREISEREWAASSRTGPAR